VALKMAAAPLSAIPAKANAVASFSWPRRRRRQTAPILSAAEPPK